MSEIVLDERFHSEAGTAEDPFETPRGIFCRAVSEGSFAVADQFCQRTLESGRRENGGLVSGEAPGGRFGFTFSKMDEPAEFKVSCVIRSPRGNEKVSRVFKAVPRGASNVRDRVDEIVHQALKLREEMA